MTELTDRLEKKFEGKLSPQQIQEIVADYEVMVKKKVDLIFQTMKFNSGNGEKALDIRESVQWVDAVQNVLCVLFQALKAMDITETKHLSIDFINKVRENLEAIANEGK